MPLLVRFLGGAYLPVDALAMFLSVLKIVFIPVALGLVVRAWLKERAARWLAVFPAISVLVIVLIIACVVALSRDKLAGFLGVTGVLVVLHNTLGVGLGYGLARLCRLPVPVCRTIAIEVGMQNSGLGVALARKHFSDALVALPAGLFSVVHNITGSTLATFWRRGDRRRDDGPEENEA